MYDNGTWHVDYDGTNGWTDGDKAYTFGNPGDYPVVIPFSDGVDRIGTFRDGYWSVDANGNGRWDGTAHGDLAWQFGNVGDIPVMTRNYWRGRGCSL